MVGSIADYKICAILFDGRDEAAVQAARERWKGLKAEEHNVTYWRQDDEGRWAKQG